MATVLKCVTFALCLSVLNKLCVRGMKEDPDKDAILWMLPAPLRPFINRESGWSIGERVRLKCTYVCRSYCLYFGHFNWLYEGQNIARIQLGGKKTVKSNDYTEDMFSYRKERYKIVTTYTIKSLQRRHEGSYTCNATTLVLNIHKNQNYLYLQSTSKPYHVRIIDSQERKPLNIPEPILLGPKHFPMTADPVQIECTYFFEALGDRGPMAFKGLTWYKDNKTIASAYGYLPITIDTFGHFKEHHLQCFATTLGYYSFLSLTKIDQSDLGTYKCIVHATVRGHDGRLTDVTSEDSYTLSTEGRRNKSVWVKPTMSKSIGDTTANITCVYKCVNSNCEELRNVYMYYAEGFAHVEFKGGKFTVTQVSRRCVAEKRGRTIWTQIAEYLLGTTARRYRCGIKVIFSEQVSYSWTTILVTRGVRGRLITRIPKPTLAVSKASIGKSATLICTYQYKGFGSSGGFLTFRYVEWFRGETKIAEVRDPLSPVKRTFNSTRPGQISLRHAGETVVSELVTPRLHCVDNKTTYTCAITGMDVSGSNNNLNRSKFYTNISRVIYLERDVGTFLMRQSPNFVIENETVTFSCKVRDFPDIKESDIGIYIQENSQNAAAREITSDRSSNTDECSPVLTVSAKVSIKRSQKGSLVICKTKTGSRNDSLSIDHVEYPVDRVTVKFNNEAITEHAVVFNVTSSVTYIISVDAIGSQPIDYELRWYRTNPPGHVVSHKPSYHITADIHNNGTYYYAVSNKLSNGLETRLLSHHFSLLVSGTTRHESTTVPAQGDKSRKTLLIVAGSVIPAVILVCLATTFLIVKSRRRKANREKDMDDGCVSLARNASIVSQISGKGEFKEDTSCSFAGTSIVTAPPTRQGSVAALVHQSNVSLREWSLASAHSLQRGSGHSITKPPEINLHITVKQRKKRRRTSSVVSVGDEAAIPERGRRRSSQAAEDKIKTRSPKSRASRKSEKKRRKSTRQSTNVVDG